MTLEARIAALAQALGADVKVILAQLAETAKVVELTQAAYDALPEKDPSTIYVVIG